MKLVNGHTVLVTCQSQEEAEDLVRRLKGENDRELRDKVIQLEEKVRTLSNALDIVSGQARRTYGVLDN